MASGTHTFGLGETFAEPQALPPPPVRHALLAFLVALAAILHFGTAGWSDIHNGPEGLYAASARDMLADGSSLVPRSAGAVAPDEPPLLHWLLLASFKAFGTTALAARIPIALAFVACVALTFLIAERLADYWRGFAAGLMYLCSCGAYMWGRGVTPEPVFAALVAGAVLCAVAGYQRRQTRRLWFAGFWFCAGAAFLTRGAFALLFLAVIMVPPALLFREARLRFRALFHWSALAAFAVIVSPWVVFVQVKFPGAILGGVWLSPIAQSTIAQQLSGVPLSHYVGAHLFWWFPALLLVLPGILLAWRKVIRPHEFAFADALPLFWIAAALLPPLLVSSREYESLAVWTGFAIFAAGAWDRISTRLRLTGIAAVAVVGVGAVVAIACGIALLPVLGGAAFHRGGGAILAVSGVALIVCCAAAAYLTWHGRETLALTALLIAMLPIGLGAAESIARNGTNLSFASVAQLLQSPPWDEGAVLFEGAAEEASSLSFYLQRGFVRVSDVPDATGAAGANLMTSEQALARMGEPQPAYLIIHKARVPWWQAELTEKFHIYHQVTTCGMHVVVNNQP